MRFRAKLWTLVVILDLGILGTWSWLLLPTSRKPADPPRLLKAYADMPLSFEANQGQADASIRYLANGIGGNVCLSSTGVLFGFAATPRNDMGTDDITPGEPPAGKYIRLRMSWPGSSANPRIIGNDLLPTLSNYFIGSDPSRWHRQIPNFRTVRYEAIYPGIDLLFYGNGRELEYDFVVAPGTDPRAIALAFTLEGNSREAVDLQIDARGDLVVGTPAGQLRQRKPKIFQEVSGIRKEIPGQYAIRNASQVGFEVGDMTRAGRWSSIRPLSILSSSVDPAAGGLTTDRWAAPLPSTTPVMPLFPGPSTPTGCCMRTTG